MDDNNNQDKEEKLKRKKIRRILLLKTDEELKKISKKNSYLMINSKTLKEINKSYNLYNILLSEKSKIYCNFVKTEEKIVSRNFKQNNSYRFYKNGTKNQKPHKILNCSIDEDNEDDSNSPKFCIIPKKIELRTKPLILKRNTKDENKIKVKNSDNFTLTKEFSNEKANRSTKLEKRGLFKLVDKIVNIKMNENIEETIKKNILKLRRYCALLRNPKKRLKRIKKQNTQNTPKIIEELNKRGNFRKRNTISVKNFVKKTLFYNQDKNMVNILLDSKKTNQSISKNIDFNAKVLYNQTEKEKSKEKELLKITYSKVLKKMNSINNKIKEKNIPPPNKRKLRKMQSLTNNFKNKLKNNKNIKNSETTKNEESTSFKTKNHLLSSKFQRPNLHFNNNPNINNKMQIKSKFIHNTGKNNKNVIIHSFFNKERRDKNKYSTRKTQRNSLKIYNKYLYYSKKENKINNMQSKNFDFVEKEDEDECENKEINFLSDFQ